MIVKEGQDLEDAFCWIRERIHAGEDLKKMQMHVNDDVFRRFVVAAMQWQYPDPHPHYDLSEMIDTAEEGARKMLSHFREFDLLISS